MRHVALITTSWPGGAPGSEAAGSFVEDFAVALSDHVRVSVLAAGSEASSRANGNLAVHRYAVPRLPLSVLDPLHPRDWPAILRSLQAGRRAVETLVAAERPDHLLALWALPAGDWARRSGARHGIPYSVWALGSDIWTLGRLPLVRSRLRSVLAGAEARYADGFLLGADVERLAGGLPCQFLPSARRLPQPSGNGQPGGPPYRLAFLGRWHTNKGVDLLLDALAALGDSDWQRIREIRLCGGGPLEQPVRAAAARLVERGRPVELRGYLGRQEAADLLGWADFLLLPSRIESIPVVFSDAVQAGTPLVATPVGDLPRLFATYRVGVVAASASAGAFATALATALETGPGAFADGIRAAEPEFDIAAAAGRLAANLRRGGR